METGRPAPLILALPVAPVDFAPGPVQIPMQFTALFVGQAAAAPLIALSAIGTPRLIAAAAILIPALVRPLRLDPQECAGAAPIAGIGQRRQQQRTHCSNQEQQLHIGTRQLTPLLGIVSLIIDAPVRRA